MPRAPKICSEPGCPEQAQPGSSRCPAHARPAWEGSGKGRGGRPWRRLRDAVLARDRWTCRDCGATGVPLEVDHLDRLADGGPLNAPTHRLQTVCQPCHQEREAARNLNASGSNPTR